VAADLGPVPFRIKVTAKPRTVAGGGDAEAGLNGGAGDALEPADELGMGFFSELQALHGALFEGQWRFHFGPVKLGLELPRDLDYLEEFWVFLLELVDVGYGEWTLEGEDNSLILEAQVFGPDVQLEFGSEKGAPGFRGKALPRRALVRLRSIVDEGTAFVSELIDDASRAHSGFGDRPETQQILEDLRALQEAVASYPALFRSQAEASPASSDRLKVLDS